MIKKHWKPIALFAVAALAEFVLVSRIDEASSNVARFGGMVLFFALGALLLYMAGRFFVYMVRTCPSQMTAAGVWVIAFILLLQSGLVF